MSESDSVTNRDSTATLSITRRSLVVSSAIGAITLVPGGVFSQSATPEAVDFETFRQLNLAITGADQLDDEGLSQILELLLADEQMATALNTLLADFAGVTDFDFSRLDFSLVVVITNILQFWYLGSFRNEPLTNRPERVAKLTSYAALPYFTAPAVCKAFGYWATDPSLD